MSQSPRPGARPDGQVKEGIPPVQTLPKDLQKVLDLYPAHSKAFHALPPEQKQEVVNWIEGARDAEHRRQRLETSVRSLR